MHAYVCIRVSVHTGVCMYVWVGGTNELGGVRFHSRLRGRRGKNSVAQFLPLGDAADQELHAFKYTCIRVYIGSHTLQCMKFAGAISAWRPTTSPNKETFPLYREEATVRPQRISRNECSATK